MSEFVYIQKRTEQKQHPCSKPRTAAGIAGWHLLESPRLPVFLANHSEFARATCWKSYYYWFRTDTVLFHKRMDVPNQQFPSTVCEDRTVTVV